MSQLSFWFPGTPRSKQSFRYTKRGANYKPELAAKTERLIRKSAKKQLPEGFDSWKKPVRVVELIYTFPFPAKTKHEPGEIQYKATRPDLDANLNKLLFDALEGVVYENDAQIVEFLLLRKVYGQEPGIKLIMEQVNG